MEEEKKSGWAAMQGLDAPLHAPWERPLVDYVRPLVRDDPTGHDVYHCLRVKRTVLRIAAHEDPRAREDPCAEKGAPARKGVARRERIDRDVMVATAYLHDVGRLREWQGEGDHVAIGMDAAREGLPSFGFPQAKIERVVRCIRYHEEYEWARDDHARRPLEVLVFQDADRLDAIGAVGLARMFCFGGAYHRPLWIPEIEPGFWQHGEIGGSTYTHLYEKLFKLKDTMNTTTGRALAEARHDFMVRFAAQFEGEWAGER